MVPSIQEKKVQRPPHGSWLPLHRGHQAKAGPSAEVALCHIHTLSLNKVPQALDVSTTSAPDVMETLSSQVPEHVTPCSAAMWKPEFWKGCDGGLGPASGRGVCWGRSRTQGAHQAGNSWGPGCGRRRPLTLFTWGREREVMQEGHRWAGRA